ncbi:MAG TPA: hypothetical protein VMH05_15955 [Bryobacteraceae bacterium]|nr:hypothetical protein [Bryobacteraceae bacterium]
MTEKMLRLAELVRHLPATRHLTPQAAGRNAFTRGLDAILLWIRRYLPPIHWLGASLFGVALFIYVWTVARTSRLTTAGAHAWPDVPDRAVLAIWHDSAPSLLVALAKRKPRAEVAIMVATEPRGDSLAVLCRLLGLRVIRGDWEHHGWPSVGRLAKQISAGASALITPDGGAPRRVARAGALVLAAAAGVPLIPIGAECYPALREPHKWDQPRNPLPFGQIAISIDPALKPDDFSDTAALESARLDLEQALNASSNRAREALGLPH